MRTETSLRLLRYGPAGHETPAALVTGDRAFDLRSVTEEIDGAFLAAAGVQRIRTALAEGSLPEVSLADQRVGSPVSRPGKIVCIGLNYADHARESGQEPPREPVVFMKAPNTVVGPNDDVLIPRGSSKTDWEVELALVIGAKARYLPDHASARACIAGYCLSNDVSEREFQLERGGQWDKGKSCETFQPLGPWLVPRSDISSVQGLGMQLAVNGVVRQRGNTSDMIFGVEEIVRYLSHFMVLEPGDVINTGTPAGVALGMASKPYLRDGDLVELKIDGLGSQRQRFRQA